LTRLRPSALADSSTQEQRAQMLFHSPRTDVKLNRNFLVAATLHEQVQNLLVAGRHFDFIQMNHG
jgi:hypothetical protein